MWVVPPDQQVAQQKLAPPELPRRKPANPRIAILTPQEGNASPLGKMCTYTKRCYAKMHGYDFIEDRTPYGKDHGRCSASAKAVVPAPGNPLKG